MKPQLPEGHTARYNHFRHVAFGNTLMILEQVGKLKHDPALKEGVVRVLPNGGITTCSVLNADGVEVAHGDARCSMSDNYCKRTGRHIALGRALARLADGEDFSDVVDAEVVDEVVVEPETPIDVKREPDNYIST